MSFPDDPPREPTMDPSDPRWVDDVLARARRRAEEARNAPPQAAPPQAAPPQAAPPQAAPPQAAPPQAAPPRSVPTQSLPPQAPSQAAPPQAPAPRHEPPRAEPVPRRRVEVQPLGEPAERATTAGGPRAAAAATAPTTATAVVDDAVVHAEPTRGARRAVAPEHAEPADDPLAPADAGTDDEPASRALRSWLEWGGVIVGALVVAFVIRAVAFQAFYIPSESMEHTLEVKDRILVNKVSYRLHEVNRGDIIVFEKPPGEASKINDLIKRVIALPGETIEQQGADLYIDRGQGPQKLTESYINDPADTGQPITWVQGCTNPSSEATKCTIPEGHVWVMGDNRGHSHDSRMFGPIDEDLIVGRAFVKVWPLNKLGFL